MNNFNSNLKTTSDNRKTYNEEVGFKNQKCTCLKSSNCNYVSNRNLTVKADDGKILTEEVVLKNQKGSVIYGFVTFENGSPAQGATVVLSVMNRNNGKPTPISFMFTDENGVFIFKINDTRYDYLINIVYN